MQLLFVLLLVFPAVLIITAPLRVFKDVLYPNFDPQKWPFISSDGFLNRVLAGHCFEIFLALFIFINIYKCWLVRQKLPYLPVTETTAIFENSNAADGTTTNNNANNNSTITDESISSYIDHFQSNKSDSNLYKQTEHVDPPVTNRQYINIQLSKIAGIYIPIIAFIVWFFGPSIYDRIYYYTGGYCLAHPEFKFYRGCVSHGYKYTGGFKCSGHSLITSTFATCLAIETISLNSWVSYINRINPLPFHIYRFSHLFVVGAIHFYMFWLIMFTVTCLFYHTFAERVVGTFCGSLVVFLVYVKYKL